jgi:hypothetical protein
MGLIAQARPTFRPHIKLRARRKVCVSRRAVTIGSAVKMLKTPTAGVLGRGHRLRSSQGAHSPYLTPHAADLAAANRGWASCGVSGKDQNRSPSLRLRAPARYRVWIPSLRSRIASRRTLAASAVSGHNASTCLYTRSNDSVTGRGSWGWNCDSNRVLGVSLSHTRTLLSVVNAPVWATSTNDRGVILLAAGWLQCPNLNPNPNPSTSSWREWTSAATTAMVHEAWTAGG